MTLRLKDQLTANDGLTQMVVGFPSITIPQTKSGSWAQSGVLTGVVTINLGKLTTPGIMKVTNISPDDDTFKDVAVRVSSGFAEFAVIRPGESYSWRCTAVSPIYTVSPSGAGSDPSYQADVFED